MRGFLLRAVTYMTYRTITTAYTQHTTHIHDTNVAGGVNEGLYITYYIIVYSIIVI